MTPTLRLTLILLALALLALLCARACAVSREAHPSPPEVDQYTPSYPKPEYPAL